MACNHGSKGLHARSNHIDVASAFASERIYCWSLVVA